GDSGTGNKNAKRVRDAYKNYTGLRKTDLILLLGDNAYSNGTDEEYQKKFFEIYPDLIRNSPVWPCLGNHDSASSDSSTQTGPYFDMFTIPVKGEAGGVPTGTEAYYSFDYANVHFICLDSFDTDRSSGGAMMTWLKADLKATSQEWIIAFWHHPPYTRTGHNSDHSQWSIEMRQNALPLLEQFGADLVLSGHSHAYERSFYLDGHYGPSGEIVHHPELVKNLGNGVSRPAPDANGPYTKRYKGKKAGRDGTVYVVAGSSGKL
ncbi:MAG: hypothetical protein GWO41_06500, partial [candidate division Zixibacteria bacterium]|nr:hypothetical protein [candidate division Zixibacteria bacterium]NIW40133.1 hypothetical protein [candidate division Zixibacteria bacterium]NIX59094.1 hypothetical protein [candidate division Zixibacteria bacterium]